MLVVNAIFTYWATVRRKMLQKCFFQPQSQVSFGGSEAVAFRFTFWEHEKQR